jgi:DNA-binding Lrp family transcriptional regulator
MIVDKSVSTVVNLTCYSPALVRYGVEPRAQLEYSAVPDRVELSDLDRKIVEFLRDKPLASLPEVGRVLGVGATTIAYRFNRLVTTQAILGFGYAYDAVNTQDNEFLVTISTRGLGSACFDLLAKLCAEDGRVWWLGRFIGQWDIQLSLSVKKAHDLDLFVQQMHAICRNQIEEIEIHTFGSLYRDR